MTHRLVTRLGWTAVAIAAVLLVALSINRREQDIQRFTGDSVSASVRVNQNEVDSAVVIRTRSGAYVIKFLAKQYFVEQATDGWRVGAWIASAPSEGHTPGPPQMALVFPPDTRTGDWKPMLAVDADRGSAPTRIDFRLLDGRRIRIDIE